MQDGIGDGIISLLDPEKIDGVTNSPGCWKLPPLAAGRNTAYGMCPVVLSFPAASTVSPNLTPMKGWGQTPRSWRNVC